MEITEGLFDGKGDGGLPLILVERIVRTGILEKVREVILAAWDVPGATKIVAGHNFRGLKIGD